jgi:protein TonB
MRKDTEVESKREQRPERDRPPEPPKIPSMNFSVPDGIAGNVVQLAPTVPTSTSMSKLSVSAGSDRSTIPLVRIQPDYPQRALMSGLEGWVLVQFTITGTGAVKDVSLVKSSNRIFEQPAVNAILRWRYRPRVENGEAVDSVGVRTIIRFALEN